MVGMAQIKIIAVPPGYAPEQIRKQWVGVILPVAEHRELAHISPLALETSGPNANGHAVLCRSAVDALRRAGKSQAADYWNKVFPSNAVLQFGKAYCEEVSTRRKLPRVRHES